VTAVTTRVAHDWRLVAPWWHWPARQDEADLEIQAARAALVRRSAPVLQKYDGPDLVNTFLADPQHRLAFRPARDEIRRIIPGPKGLFSLPTSEPTGLRKLYLGSHHRHYLVLASLHCAAPGFPRVDREGVCRAGFVVRRRTTELSREARRAGDQPLARLEAARRRRAGAEAQLGAAVRAGRLLRCEALEARLSAAAATEQDALAAVRCWAEESGVRSALQGWVPRGVRADGTIGPLPACGTPAPAPMLPVPGVGAWQPVAELPGLLEEATFPLYPLVPDPRLPGHDGAGESIWFGVVPTGSSDVDPAGGPRFDDASDYEIRCFVRRHRPECPAEGGHCHCPVIWSEPTAPYRLAPHLDLEGTANRPVTVQLPDLARLQAETLLLGPGRTGGVRFQTPAGSAMPFTTSNLDAAPVPDSGPARFCSFAIPLLTIVATFLFKLFLPIVVLVFQLWFLLALRFCIPPEVNIAAGSKLALAFSSLGAGLDIKADVAARFGPGGDLEKDLDDALNEMFKGRKDKDGVSLAERLKNAKDTGTVDTTLYAALARNALAQSPAPPPDLDGTAADPVFAPRIRRDQVVSP
jgi:hypothetical protein